MSQTIPLGRGLHFNVYSAGAQRGLVGRITVPRGLDRAAAAATDDFVVFQVNLGPEASEGEIKYATCVFLRDVVQKIGAAGGGLTACEALAVSKETGRSFSRSGSKFMQWDETWQYRFDPAELVAADWEDVETFIPKLTRGRWGAADYPPDRHRAAQATPFAGPAERVLDHFPVPPREATGRGQRAAQINDETYEASMGAVTLDCQFAREHLGKNTAQLDAFWHELEALYRKHFV